MLNQDASVRDYQEYLEKTILKLNYKSFTQIVILGSSSFVPFMQLKSDRRTIIEDLLDIEIFSVMNQLLKQRVAQNKEDMGTVDIALGLSKGEKENVEYLIEKLKQNKTSQIEPIKETSKNTKRPLQIIESLLIRFLTKIKNLMILLRMKKESEKKLLNYMITRKVLKRVY